jgi:high affinity sulfate transporter 1
VTATSVVRALPGLGHLLRYPRGWLRHDVVAGLVLVTLLVPQGMAYAELAGLPPITGLYTTAVALLAYAVVGPSRVLVLGPDSSLGPVIAATITPLVVADNAQEAVAYASVLALLVGAVTAAAGLLRLGFVADLLSRPTQLGYINGLALTILVSQLPKLCGFSVDADGLIPEARAFVSGATNGEVVGLAVTVGVGSLAVILLCQRFLRLVPGVLVAVVLSVLAVRIFDLPSHGVAVVGAMPQGFPPLTVPSVDAHDLPLLVAGALGIAVVSLTDTISTASVFAARSGDEVDGDREMVGVGAASLAAGLFQGFPVSTSGSRTAVAVQNGARSPLASLIGAAGVLAMLLVAPGLLKNLPQPALAAIVIAASLSLADLPGLARLRRVRTSEFVLAIAAFLGVAVLGVLPGIGVAVALSILNVFRRSWWPHQAVLGRTHERYGFHDVVFHEETEHLPGLALYRFDAPLLFVNARSLREQIRRLAATDPRPRWLVLAAEPITDVDTTAADMLADLEQELTATGTRLVFAELKDAVREKIERYELVDALGDDRYYPTVRAAVEAYQAETGLSWVPGPGPYRLSAQATRSSRPTRARPSPGTRDARRGSPRAR